jgi:signal transduction histidine kinase
MTAAQAEAPGRELFVRSSDAERSVYRISFMLGSFFITATSWIHGYLDPEAIDPLGLRLLVSALVLGVSIVIRRGSERRMRVLVLGTICIVNLYFGLLGGANQMRGLWLQAFFTAYISSMLVAGPFAPTMRSAWLRSLLITSGAGAACALTPMGWPFALMTTMHFGIIATFVSLVSTMHIRTRAKLESKRDEAMAATRAKAQFLANMSHEIRTPMNGVLGTASLLDDGSLRGDQKELVQTLNASGEALLGVINDILDFSKVEAGAIEIESTPFDLGRMLTDSVELLRPVAKARGNTLELQIEAVPKRVVGDALRVRQIVTNLLSNAIKFTERGEIALRATWSRGECTISVIDTGIGIAPDRLERIFESFSQGDDSITRRFGGTGLGLTISRQIAGLMNGTVRATSESGTGSEFTLVVPLPEAESDLLSKDEQPSIFPDTSASRAAGGGALQGLSVLLVDDNAVNRRVAGRMLERLGLSPVLAVDGVEAVAAAKGTDFDVILMDVQMPHLDGLEATRMIRAFEGTARPWIIALTAGATAEEREASRLAGADEHLTKPIRLDELRQAFGRVSVQCG